MSENVVLEGFKTIGKGAGAWCCQNKAHIFTALSVAGTITTGIMAAQGGARAARKIDRREQELGRRLTRGEKLKLCGKDFIAPAVSGIIAAGSAVGSDIVNTRVIGRQTALLIASEKAYEKLSEKTKEVLGEKKAKQVQDEIAKEKLEESQKAGVISLSDFDNAPRSGSGKLYPYVDEYTMLPFWSNPDYISSCVKDMQKLMLEIHSRGDNFDIYDKEVGVPYSEWLKSLNFPKEMWDSPERKHTGWNKGYSEDGCDDDSIGYFTTTVEWKNEPGLAVTMIVWETKPTDMRLGRLIKANGM